MNVSMVNQSIKGKTGKPQTGGLVLIFGWGDNGCFNVSQVILLLRSFTGIFFLKELFTDEDIQIKSY